MDEALRKQIVKDLSNYRSRDDILRELCFSHGYQWDEAVAVVDAIAYEEYDTIISRKRPMVLGVNAVMAVGGLTIILGMIFLGLSDISIKFLRLPIPFLGNAVFGIGGLGLMIRGVVGMYDAWQATHFSS